jgi:hypothetical protein
MDRVAEPEFKDNAEGDTEMGTMLVNAGRHVSARALPNGSNLPTIKRKDDHRRRISVVLWTVQGLLALLFLGAGGMKLAMPSEVLATMTPLPILFMKFIGVAEVLGGLGLVLPGLTQIRPGLTPLAAACLAVEMIGATATTLVVGGGMTALMPLVVGLLAAFVAHGRWLVARQPGRSCRPAVASADPILPHSR